MLFVGCESIKAAFLYPELSEVPLTIKSTSLKTFSFHVHKMLIDIPQTLCQCVSFSVLSDEATI